MGTDRNAKTDQLTGHAAEREQAPRRAVWNRPEWCAALNLGGSTFYTLEIRPRSVKIGKRLLIVESPAEYVARIAAMQAKA